MKPVRDAQSTFVSTAEAAYLADVSTQQMNRFADEKLVSFDFLIQTGQSRRYSQLVAVFARFFFDFDELLQANFRKSVVAELTSRVENASKRRTLVALEEMVARVDWKVQRSGIELDISEQVQRTLHRARELSQAEALVKADPEILNGLPCFAGTRIPIESILASLDEGMSEVELAEHYPDLTPQHIEAARLYAKVHPRRGRPPRLKVGD